MYVNEFSRRLGIPSSKVRYYDRIGLYQGERFKNNYRNYTDSDALDVYFARSLRSVDMSVKETLYAIQNYNHSQLLSWLSTRSDELEAEIAHTKAKLERLEQIYQRFNIYSDFLESEEKVELLDMIDGQKTYSVYTFGDCADNSEEALNLAEVLGKAMPYTYISIKIPQKSLLSNVEKLSVGLGLGIIEENLKYCGIQPSDVMECGLGGPCLSLFLELENLFDLTRSDLQPLIDAANKRNVKLVGDISGHVAFSFHKDGKRYYAFSLACQIEPLN